MKLILVDDDKLFLKVASAYFKQDPSIEIESYFDSEEAMYAIKRNIRLEAQPYFRLVLDLNMPGISGQELAIDLCDSFTDVNLRIAILTSSNNPSEKEALLSLPYVVDFFTKPLTKELVSEIIKTME